ncbi:MAG: hypothetical protein ACRD4U_04440, partial [Candidatus Acidiferrales bacterium]
MILPFVEQAIRPLEESPSLQAALRALERAGAPSEVTLAGLTDTAKLLATALAARALGRPVFLVTASNRRAETLLEPLRFFYGVLTGRPESAVAFLPAHDVSPYRGLSTHPEIAAERAQALWRLAIGEAELAVVALPAALGRLASREQYAALGRTVAASEALDREEFIAYLEGAGYERREPVEMPGEFSVRGGIVDIFPVEGRPLRLEFFGDTLEELRQFDPATQRSTSPLTAATLVPLLETPRTPERLTRLWALKEGREPARPAGGPEGSVNPFPGWEFLVPLAEGLGGTLLELAPRALVVLDEPRSLREEADKLWSRLEEEHAERRGERAVAAAPGELFLRWSAFDAALRLGSESATAAARPRLHLEELALEISGADHFALVSQPTPHFRGFLRAFVEEVRQRLRQGGPVLVASATSGEMERMAEILSEY